MKNQIEISLVDASDPRSARLRLWPSRHAYQTDSASAVTYQNERRDEHDHTTAQKIGRW